MGWKAVKEYYGLDAIVHVKDGKLYVASFVVPDLLIVHPDGRKIEPSWPKVLEREDMAEFVRKVEEDPDRFAELLAQEDEFESHIPVYTFGSDGVEAHFCEKLGWPNVTHDGHLMFASTFFADPDEALKAGRLSAEDRVGRCRANVEMLEAKLAEARAELERAVVDLAAFDEKVNAREQGEEGVSEASGENAADVEDVDSEEGEE